MKTFMLLVDYVRKPSINMSSFPNITFGWPAIFSFTFRKGVKGPNRISVCKGCCCVFTQCLRAQMWDFFSFLFVCLFLHLLAQPDVVWKSGEWLLFSKYALSCIHGRITLPADMAGSHNLLLLVEYGQKQTCATSKHRHSEASPAHAASLGGLTSTRRRTCPRELLPPPAWTPEWDRGNRATSLSHRPVSRISAYSGKLLKFSPFFCGFFWCVCKEKSEIGKRDYLAFFQGRAKIPESMISANHWFYRNLHLWLSYYWIYLQLCEDKG